MNGGSKRRELRKVRVNEVTSKLDRIIRVPDGGNFLSDVVRAGENVSGKWRARE